MLIKRAAICLAGAATAALIWLGYARHQDFYLWAVIAGFVFFRLTTGSACPFVWLLGKAGVSGLACPADIKKTPPGRGL